jgi:glycine oxidase
MKVVIVGGGVAGLAIGWRLLQAGAGVTVLERGQPGMGATWASAGMISVTAETAEAAVDESAFARESSNLWPDFTAELEHATGQGIGYSRTGALMLAQDTSALSAFQGRAAAEPGLTVLGTADLHARVPLLADGFAGALWAADEAHVDNRALGAALAAAVLRAGGTIAANEAAVRIVRHAGRAALVETPFARYPADAVLVAAGAWTCLIEAGIPIRPVKGEMIALAAPPEASPPGPVVWGGGIYAVPRGRRLLIGATVEEAGFDTSLTAAGRDGLRAAAEGIMPGLKDWSLDEHWAGLRPRAPDGLPLLGPAATPGLFVAGGQYRNGILFAPAIARRMADIILGRAAPIAAFDPRRFA